MYIQLIQMDKSYIQVHNFIGRQQHLLNTPLIVNDAISDILKQDGNVTLPQVSKLLVKINKSIKSHSHRIFSKQAQDAVCMQVMKLMRESSAEKYERLLALNQMLVPSTTDSMSRETPTEDLFELLRELPRGSELLVSDNESNEDNLDEILQKYELLRLSIEKRMSKLEWLKEKLAYYKSLYRKLESELSLTEGVQSNLVTTSNTEMDLQINKLRISIIKLEERLNQQDGLRNISDGINSLKKIVGSLER